MRSQALVKKLLYQNNLSDEIVLMPLSFEAIEERCSVFIPDFYLNFMSFCKNFEEVSGNLHRRGDVNRYTTEIQLTINC